MVSPGAVLRVVIIQTRRSRVSMAPVTVTGSSTPGPGRAAQLSAFFRDPHVLALSEQLRAAGIDGFQ